MKRLFNFVLAVCTVSTLMLMVTSCNDGETYAEQKEKERKAISKFITSNDIVGTIHPITESQFYAQDSTTNLDRNEFVQFSDGVYMQIVRKGEGKSMVEMAKERPDSTVTRRILCKFLEYDIESADTTYTNFYMSSIIDEMMCTYSHYSRSYTASFTTGLMRNYYNASVPMGWLKPLNFIRLTKVAGEEAKVRLIVPHSSGTTNASSYVLPFYYEITYQMSPND